MAAKEARARIKINKRLEEAGWRFFEEDGNPASSFMDIVWLIRNIVR